MEIEICVVYIGMVVEVLVVEGDFVVIGDVLIVLV